MRATTLMFATLTLLTACTGWQVQQVSPAELIAREHPARVRVTTSARQVTLAAPFIAGDSIVGSSKASPLTALALADVTRVEVRRANTANTVLAVAGATALIAVSAAASWSMSNWSFSW